MQWELQGSEQEQEQEQEQELEEVCRQFNIAQFARCAHTGRPSGATQDHSMQFNLLTTVCVRLHIPTIQSRSSVGSAMSELNKVDYTLYSLRQGRHTVTLVAEAKHSADTHTIAQVSDS